MLGEKQKSIIDFRWMNVDVAFYEANAIEVTLSNGRVSYCNMGIIFKPLPCSVLTMILNLHQWVLFILSWPQAVFISYIEGIVHLVFWLM